MAVSAITALLTVLFQLHWLFGGNGGLFMFEISEILLMDV